MRAVHGDTLDLLKRAREPIQWWRSRQAALKSDRTVAGQPGAARISPDAPAAGGGDPGRHADRDPQTRSTALLQGVQGLPAADLLVGGTGRRAALGVPRRQCPGWLPAASGAEGLPGRGGGHRHNQGLSASAGYQQDLLLYCGEGKDARFGVIEFSADVTEEFRKATRAAAD